MIKNDERFINFMDSVHFRDRFSVRTHILLLCEITPASFYKWIKGTSTPSSHRREVINGIAFKFGYPIVYDRNKGYYEQDKIQSFNQHQKLKRHGKSKNIVKKRRT